MARRASPLLHMMKGERKEREKRRWGVRDDPDESVCVCGGGGSLVENYPVLSPTVSQKHRSHRSETC